MVHSLPVRRLFALLLLLLLLLLSAAAAAQAAGSEPAVRVLHAQARPSLPGTPGIAYLELQNTSAAGDTLVQATSPIADRVELHEMTMKGDVMSMRQLKRLPVAGKKTVRIDEDSGLHLMFVGLHKPLKAGDAFSLTLVFEHAGAIQTQVTVQARPGD